MTSDDSRGDSPRGAGLRARAERRLALRGGASAEPEPDDARAIVAELEVHQTELELQNESLQESYVALEAERERYRSLFEQAPVGYLTITADDRVDEVNETAATLLDRRREELVGERLFLLFRSEDRDAVYLLLQRLRGAAKDGGRCVVLPAGAGPDGPWLRVDGAAAPTDGGRLRLWLADVTAQRARERAREAARELLQTTLDGVDDPIMVVGLDHRVLLMNRAVRERYPTHEPGTMTCHGVSHGRSRPCADEGEPCPLAEVQATSQAVRVLHEHVQGDGELRTIEIVASPLFGANGRLEGIIESSRDITDRVRLEQRAARADRLESLGVLAGGIAHDFNNLLAVIQGNFDLAWEHLHATVGAHYFDHAFAALRRAAGITRQLLTFARGGAPVRRPCDLGELVAEAAGFVTRGSNTRCVLDLPPDLWLAHIDPDQCTQVVHHLTLNARQAMPGGGLLRIEVANVTVDELPATLEPGRYLRLTVRDNGPGIAAEHLDRVFDPYFTTREDGTGLGLASAWSIVTRHGGTVDVASTPGEGACFQVWLPAAEEVAEAPALAAVTRRREEGGRVLAMDDDPLLRDLLQHMLAVLGYEVTVAEDGAAAIQRYQEAREAGQPFDAVILDLTVPRGMGGAETIRRLRELDPEVRALVSSGYSNDPVMAHWQDHGFRATVPKPYTRRELALALEQTLG